MARDTAQAAVALGGGHGLFATLSALRRLHDDLTIDDRPFNDDVAKAATAELDDVHLGRLAAYVRDMRIPLEMCPSSNVQTGAAKSIALHPITLLKRLRFRVTVNTDNRLMSGTTMSREMELLVTEAGWTMEDLRWVTINAMKSAFIPFDERLALIDGVVKPGYEALLTP